MVGCQLLIWLIIVSGLLSSVVLIMRSKSRIKIEEKRIEYGTLLEDARRLRRFILKATGRVNEYSNLIQGIKKEMQAEKTKLLIIKKELRAQLKELRMKVEKKQKDRLDKKSIEQLKIKLHQQWAFCNNLKWQFNAMLKKKNEFQKEHDSIARELKTKSEEWKEFKVRVMRLYDDLKEKIKIDDPRVFLKAT